jgi:hypothetical protein
VALRSARSAVVRTVRLGSAAPRAPPSRAVRLERWRPRRTRRGSTRDLAERPVGEGCAGSASHAVFGATLLRGLLCASHGDHCFSAPHIHPDPLARIVSIGLSGEDGERVIRLHAGQRVSIIEASYPDPLARIAVAVRPAERLERLIGYMRAKGFWCGGSELPVDEAQWLYATLASGRPSHRGPLLHPSSQRRRCFHDCTPRGSFSPSIRSAAVDGGRGSAGARCGARGLGCSGHRDAPHHVCGRSGRRNDGVYGGAGPPTSAPQLRRCPSWRAAPRAARFRRKGEEDGRHRPSEVTAARPPGWLCPTHAGGTRPPGRSSRRLGPSNGQGRSACLR